MGAERFADEMAQNMEMKIHCVLVCDTSASMKGEKIDELNQCIRTFYRQVQEGDGVPEQLIDQLELAIIQYDDDVKIIRNPKLLEENEVPPTLTTGGSNSEMVMAFEEAIQLIEDRKEFYIQTNQKCYRPWIILITGSEPFGRHCSESDLQALFSRILDDSRKRKYKIQYMCADINNKSLMDLLKKNFCSLTLYLKHTLITDFFTELIDDDWSPFQLNDTESVNIKHANWLDEFNLDDETDSSDTKHENWMDAFEFGSEYGQHSTEMKPEDWIDELEI